MRKALLERFILVLLAALCINSVIFYIASSKMMLKNSKNDMTYTIKAVDSILDYDRDLMEQMERLEAFTDQDSSRVTLIKSDGTVVTDSDADAEYLDNHQGREEIRAAMEHGEGYARRYSKTLGKTMLYVACRSEYSDMVLRLAVPYSGIQEYLPMLFPAAILSFLMAMVCSVVTTRRFVSSVTRPLRDISKAVMKVKGDYTELQFESCQYHEINVIAETIMNMSKDVKEYLSQIEKEKQIRQEFFSNASHELKTPMTTISGFAEGILDGTIPPERERESLQIIVSETRRLSRLNALAEDTVTAQEQFDLTEVVSQVLISLETKITGRKLDVDVQMPDGKLMVWGDPDSITQVCYNLVDNAAKFAPEGSTITVQISKKDGKAYTTVQNLGATIPPDELPLLFDRFHKADYSRSMDREGVGLGLYIVKTILNKLKENINVTSEDGVTRFTFTLTLA